MTRRFFGVLWGAVLMLILGAPASAGTTSPGNQSLSAPYDWPMYGHDLTRSFANPASGINVANVGRFTRAWSFATGDAVTTQAVTYAGVVYIGSWDGYFYALDQTTGVMRWKFAVDCQNAIIPSPAHCLTPAQAAATTATSAERRRHHNVVCGSGP